MALTIDLPSPNDYLAAVQNPRNCFPDPALAAGQTVQTPLGLPKVASGNFAVVFQVLSGQARYAVKCFTRRSEGQQRRYAAISKYLRECKLPYFVEFAYLPQGIRVRGAAFPIVKMEWAVGKLLHLFVEENLRRPAALAGVAEEWRKVVADLAAARISHGDLQHRNVVVQGSRILLIDYDDMYVPALRGEVGTEAGHEHFQHPQRTSADFGEWRDAFPSIVIYLSLRAVAADHSLWREFHLGENLILSKTDYQRAGQTRVWGRLAQSSDEVVRRLAVQLQAYCRQPIRDVPTLEEALGGQAQQAAVVTASPQRPARVDYVALGKALGIGQATSGRAPTRAPAEQAPARPQTVAPSRLVVDWQLLKRIEEAQRAVHPPEPAPSKPTRAKRTPSTTARRRTGQSKPAAKPTPPEPRAPPGLLERWKAIERAFSRIVRVFIALLMLAVTAFAALVVCLYLALPWIEAHTPGLSGALGPVIQLIRDLANTVIPTPGQLMRSGSGLYPN